MLLPNINKAQAKFLKGDALTKYGTKRIDFADRAKSGLGKFILSRVQKLQKAILRNIARAGSISSGNLYQEVGGSIRQEQTPHKIAAYMLLPKYADFVDKGVKGSKSSYPSASQSPYGYKDKKPPRKVLEQHLIRKYGTPKNELYAVSKSMQDKIFKKGLKSKKIYSKNVPVFQKEIEMGVPKIVQEAVIINILEL